MRGATIQRLRSDVAGLVERAGPRSVGRATAALALFVYLAVAGALALSSEYLIQGVAAGRPGLAWVRDFDDAALVLLSGVVVYALVRAMASAVARAARAEEARRQLAERERAARADAEAARRHRDAVLNRITDNFFALDHEWRFTYVNRNAERYLGRSREELVGRDVWEAFPMAVDSEFEDAYRRAWRTGEAVTMEAESTVAPGRWLQVHVYPSEDGLSVFSCEITDRVRAEDRLRRITAASPAVLYTLAAQDGSLVPTWVSDNVESWLGYTVDEVLAPGWWEEHLHPDDRARVVGATDGLLEAGRIAQEYRVRAADGEYRWVLEQARLTRDRSGCPATVVGSWMDHTEFRRLESRLHDAKKMEAIGRLAGGIAHDFNNVLTAIKGTAQLALMDLGSDDPLRTDLEEIEQSATRAAALTDQLLAFGRRNVLEPRTIDVNALLGGMTGMLRAALDESIELVCTPTDGPALVDADPSRLEEVVMNLAVNARDAMPDGGRLEIAVRPGGSAAPGEYPPGDPLADAEQVLIVVSDTGHGMDEDTLDRVFEPFFTTKEQGRGSGLGLSTAYGIIEQTGGTIEAESTEGRGTWFTIRLPRATEGSAARGAGEESEVASASAGRTVLLVEDDPSVRLIARRILTRDGYRVLEAASGPDALELYRTHPEPIDLLLTDVVMPEMSGQALAERVLEQSPHVAVLYMSGYSEDAVLRRGALGEEGALIQKPFSPERLSRTVAATLQSSPDRG